MPEAVWKTQLENCLLESEFGKITVVNVDRPKLCCCHIASSIQLQSQHRSELKPPRQIAMASYYGLHQRPIQDP